MEGVYEARSSSISSSASSILCLRYDFRIALIVRLRLLKRDWTHSRSFRADTLVLTSLHTAYDIQALLLASIAFNFGIALRRSAKSLSSLIRVVGGRRGYLMCRPRYWECSLRVALRRDK